jgi:ribulose bisphosphate carboxylase small subunit
MVTIEDKENLRLEDNLIEKEIEIKEYQNKIEHLRMLLESKTPKYIRNCGIDEISTPDILTPEI